MLLAGVGLFWLPTVVLATDQAGPRPELFGGGQWLLSLLSLIVVVFLAYWTTRFLAGHYRNLPTRHIKVAETLCLGSNRHLYLLIVNKQALLVGSTEHGLALLKEYDDPGFCEELQLTVAPQQSMAAGRLFNWLTPLLKNPERKSGSAKARTEKKGSGRVKLTANLNRNTNRFKALLTNLINEAASEAPFEETPRERVSERLQESLARIRAWKNKG